MKKRIPILIAALALLACANVLAATPEQSFAKQINGKWRYFDAYGRELALGTYDNARSFSNGFAAVFLNGKWAFIAENSGLAITPYIYDDVSSLYVNGEAWVKQNGEWRLEQIIDPGHIVRTSSLLPPSIYPEQQAKESPGKAKPVQPISKLEFVGDNKYGCEYIENIVPVYMKNYPQAKKFDYASHVMFGDGNKRGLYDNTGACTLSLSESLFYCPNCIICEMPESLAVSDYCEKLHKTFYTMFFNIDTGKPYCLPTGGKAYELTAENSPYEAAAYILPLGISVNNNTEWGYMKQEISYKLFDANFNEITGIEILDYKTTHGSPLIYLNGKNTVYSQPLNSGDTFTAKGENGKWNIYSLDGKALFSENFEDARPLFNGVAAVKKGGAWGYVNEIGEAVTPFSFSEAASAFENGTAWVKHKNAWQLLKIF